MVIPLGVSYNLGTSILHQLVFIFRKVFLVCCNCLGISLYGILLTSFVFGF